jgi:hypothetical protein
MYLVPRPRKSARSPWSGEMICTGAPFNERAVQRCAMTLQFNEQHVK